MKTYCNSIVLAVALSTGTGLAGEPKVADCPPAVRGTIEANTRGGTVDEVERFTVGASELYVAEIEGPRGRDIELHITADGGLLKTVEDIRLAAAPEAVRIAVAAMEGTVDDVDKVTVGKAVTYHIELDRAGAPDLEVVLSPDGKVVRQAEEMDD
ncbi:hypothetical protein [Luteolibacter marinus]|uniref:hypothetical protein n=1 Tax=Luteolibacter marinus TaxID=2776705 RepID=UPI00186885E4|nr:hypothetical protein [Luteolibacter marinus]